jgi:hypothetical protein
MSEMTPEFIKEALEGIGIEPKNSTFTYHDALRAMKLGVTLASAISLESPVIPEIVVIGEGKFSQIPSNEEALDHLSDTA